MDLPREVWEQIPLWKDMGYELYQVLVPTPDGEKPVIFRTLTKREFDALTASRIDDLAALVLGPYYTIPYEPIVRAAVLWPSPIPGDWPAGTDRLLSEAIVQASPWSDKDGLVAGLEDARDYASTLMAFLTSRVCTAFPYIKPEEVENMTFSRLMRLVALSEIMTGVQVDLQPFLDPEGYEKRLEREARERRREQLELSVGIRTDRNMRDPKHRQQMRQMAEESKARLKLKHGRLDYAAMNRALAGT